LRKKYLIILFLLIYIPFAAIAQYFYTPQLLVPIIESAPALNSRAAVLIDAATGALLYAKNPQEEIPPASLTKLMTMHLLMKEIEEGRASYDEIIPITVERWAQRQPPRSSLMWLEPRHIVTLREIMLGLSVASGNDAAVAAALRLAPTMEDFAHEMTMEARRMGLYVTRFVESSGISEYNMTTAEEFASFCRQYIALHPGSLKDFHSEEVFLFPTADNVIAALRNNPRTFTHYNRNNLLRTFPGTDGLKTGYIDQAGFNIALTAERNNTRFISVTLGAESARMRELDSFRLLSWAFENFKTVRPVIDVIKSQPLWKGRVNTVDLVLADSVDFTSPVNRANTLSFETFIPQPLIAPLSAGTLAGYHIISDEYGELHRIPLITVYNYERGNILKRIWHSIRLLFRKS
jgi:D-alanyl-D-alanine carboxypeptidase (penicillin-binding protein 5/6)